MKKILIGLFVLLSAASHATELDLRSGDSIKVNVYGCEKDQTGGITVSGKSVTAFCAPTSCQAEHAHGNMYKVYRFSKDQCTYQGCNNQAKEVGEFKIETRLFLPHLVSDIKKGMSEFLTTPNDCGSLRFFVSGAYNGGKGFYQIEP